MKKKRFISFSLALFLICFQPFIQVSRAQNTLESSEESSETGSVGNADAFYTASGSVDGHVGFSAFLGLSGIYLKADADAALFTDVSLELDSLWEDFKQDVSGITGSLGDLGGSIVRGGLAFSKNTWNAFGNFARWIKDKFNLSDNQESVNLSDIPTDTALLSTTFRTKVGNGYYSSSNYNIQFTDGYFQLYDVTTTSISLYGFYRGSGGSSYVVSIYNAGDKPVAVGVKLYCDNGYGTVEYNVGPGKTIYPGESADTPVHINSNFNSAFIKTSGTTIDPPESSEQSILSVDTGTINIPADIPEDAEGGDSMGGILLPALGSGLGGAAGAVAGTIIDGVMGGVMPDIDIKPADVKIPPNMEIDDDGNIFPSDLEFRPTDVFLDSDAYKLDTLTNYFPFSIPWDLMHFAAMFRAEPEIPIIDFILPMPEGIDDIVIHVDLTPFDSVATLARSGLFSLFAIRWLMFLYRKFG